ncbi:F-box domain containing protein [Tanacetum coccineum]|uniref:F-box domain containing protein n=1 Tax=Tanacetum coccineum TaxID=301880 RepID=A0ABQ5J3Z5_9ASTR
MVIPCIRNSPNNYLTFIEALSQVHISEYMIDMVNTYTHDKALKMDLEGLDRLGNLQDELIHKILSFMDMKFAVQTCVLASKWRFMWTQMPYFNISSDNFRTFKDFSEFVDHVLRHRNNQTEVVSVRLNLCDFVRERLIRVLQYAFSHNVKQLTFSCEKKRNFEFPLDVLRSRSLKCLKLIGCYEGVGAYPFTLASTWELPALTTLSLDCVTLSKDITDKGIGLISKCKNLKNLTLNHFRMMDSDAFSICHSQLSNLTLKNGHQTYRVVKVVAPQLKNLHIINCDGRHVISAPNLVSLVFKHCRNLEISAEDFCSLEKVDLCMCPKKSDEHEIVGMLLQLHNVKFLTINVELIEFLSSYMELISPSLCANLESLKIYPLYVPAQEQAQINLDMLMFTKLKHCNLDMSPTSSFGQFTFISCKETLASRNAISTRYLLERLRVILESEKVNVETNRAYMDRGKTPVNIHEAYMKEQRKTLPMKGLRPHKVEKMAQPLIKSYWKDSGMQIDEKKTKTCGIIEGKMALLKKCWEDGGMQIFEGITKTCRIKSKLQDIEVLLMSELPASKRDKFRACSYSLRAEADPIVKKIVDHMIMQENHLSGCFRELATTSHKLLSPYMELISPSSLAILESLKIHPVSRPVEENAKIKVSNVKHYFLDISPKIILDISTPTAANTSFQCKGSRASRNATIAQNQMVRLRAILGEEKANIEKNGAHIDRLKTALEIRLEAEMQELGKTLPMAKIGLHIKSCWEDVGVHIDEVKEKTRRILSKLEDIEAMIMTEPVSNRDKLQAYFTTLRAEVYTTVKKIIDRLMIQQSRLSDCFHELATNSQLPS